MSTRDHRASMAGSRRSRSREVNQTMGHTQFGRPRRALRMLESWLVAGILLGTQLAVPAAQAAPIRAAAAVPAAVAAAALVNPTNTVTLGVESARTELRAFGGSPRTALPADPAVPTGVKEGDPVTTYKWMINEDNTGENTTRNADPGSDCSAWLDAGHTSPNTAYPDSCHWTSISGLRSSAPVAAQGDETTLNISTGVDAEARPVPHLRRWRTATSSTGPRSRSRWRRLRRVRPA